MVNITIIFKLYDIVLMVNFFRKERQGRYQEINFFWISLSCLRTMLHKRPSLVDA